MVNYNLFITGYPGFLASSLIQQLVNDHKNEIKHINLLVLPSQEMDAKNNLTGFITKHDLPENLFSIIKGDITKPDLNLSPVINRALKNSVTHVFHLAAIYDLAVPQEIAQTVNVNGTINVNYWTENLLNLKRYIYFSTAYVSGRREGKIFESDLVMEQSFRNQYEKTKYEAEVLVEKLKTVIPTTIIRPGVVKGHSKTGETIKFDGIYFILNFMEHLKFLPVIPYLGEGEAEGNFVPSDYVLKATSYLSMKSVGEGKTYHLTDPNPYTMREIHKIIAERYLNKTPSGQLPLSLAKQSLSLSFVRKWLQVEKEAMDYFSIHSSYDSSKAVEDLEGTGITCPDLKDTIEPMISFYQKYKHDRSKHISIK
ncbi:SDR family oxidoreductase [Virgibacillus flavescens]|uniref:SDR family oxidoreductase n=1 Tax=Virgibacillus flavescens TaxID=1611422 RepID=UPI003D3327C1